MVTAKLKRIPHIWRPTLGAGAVIGLTVVGVGLGVADPGLAGSTRPHAALTGSLGDAVDILQTNARVLSAPFLLVVLGFPDSRFGRGAGDLLVTILTAANAMPVGLELGRWQGRLLPYLPQLPFEWAALGLAVNAWVTARNGDVPVRRLAPLAAVTLALSITAASLETWCTPHAQSRTRVSQSRADIAHEPISPAGAGNCFRHGFCADSGHTASRSRAPSPCSARFRSAAQPALTGLQQPPPTPTRTDESQG